MNKVNATPETVGNQFGFVCPKCKEGDKILIVATTTVQLYPDGSEDQGSHEWDKDSGVSCGHVSCLWLGNVRDLKQAPNFEEE